MKTSIIIIGQVILSEGKLLGICNDAINYTINIVSVIIVIKYCIILVITMLLHYYEITIQLKLQCCTVFKIPCTRALP